MKKVILSSAITIALFSSWAASDTSQKEQDGCDINGETGMCSVDEKATTAEYYNDSERGWFWYETKEGEMVKKYIEEERPTEQPTVIPKKPKKPQEEVKPEDQPLSTAWLNKNFKTYMNRAIDNPNDVEAMRTYLYLEKYMREKSTAFGYARQAAVYSDPFLDSTSNRATANFGMKSMNVDAAKKKESVLKRVGEKTGIFFFFRSDCPYCHKQAPLVKLMADRYGFTVKMVSIDGANLPDNPWGDQFYVNQGQAENLKVAKVPALYLYNSETNETSLISQGLQSAPQLEKRILYSANRAKLISDEEMKLTRPSGLYKDINGNIGGATNVPDNAPKEFMDLYQKSLQFKAQAETEFKYETE